MERWSWRRGPPSSPGRMQQLWSAAEEVANTGSTARDHLANERTLLGEHLRVFRRDCCACG